MKKSLPYILVAIFVVLIGLAIASAKRMKALKTFDERITLKQNDKIPYGMAAARTLLPSLFPGASIFTDNKGPGYWNSSSEISGNQAIILVAKCFEADEYDVNRLMNFARQGNHVMIISRSFSYETQKAFHFDTYLNLACEYQDFVTLDSVSLTLDKQAFASDSVYVYPGKKYENWFSNYDSIHSVVLGRNAEGQPDFIQMKIGTGTISIHTVPIAFSNYFILHKNNIEYFQKAFSVIPARIEKITWNEYYLNKRNTSKKSGSLFGVLFRYPPFKWGLLLAGFILLLYLILQMRRKQRHIPIYQKPKNDSLDFVKTMGRLYYERRDHRNLSIKMSMYFLEHVRTRYKLATNNLDKEFEQLLQYKSNYSQQGIEDIVSFIRYLKTGESITENQLAKFHSQLESFYLNT